jgi:hypothetical protein
MSIRALDAKATAQAVKDIAAQFSRPLSEVHEILHSQLGILDRQARIKQYVPLLAIKQVKELIRSSRSSDHSVPTQIKTRRSAA